MHKILFRQCLQIALLGASSGGLVACVGSALRPTPTCAKVDWYEIGRRDGAEGKVADENAATPKECARDLLQGESEAYENGWNAGVVEFCTASAGLEAGRSGQTYEQVCPTHLERGFLEGYRAGVRIHELEEKNVAISRRIDSLSQSLEKASPAVGPASVTDSKNLSRLRSQLDDLKRQQATVDEQISATEEAIERIRR